MQEALSFGPWLKQRRRALDLTQEELAARAVCSPSTLRKIEAGLLLPSKELARLLALALGVPAAEQEAFIAFARDERRSSLAPAFVASPLASPPQSPLPQVEARAQQGATARRLTLPAQLTPLIGRAAEMTAIQALLARADCTLLTIIGPGGIGKTRLALAVAQQLPHLYPDGIYFVAFVGVTAPDYMVSTIAAALGFAFAGDSDPQTQLLNYLATKRLLLLFDNLEHLLDGAGLVVELLQAAPGLKVLVTSRERLAVAGEWVFDLPALATPPAATEVVNPAALVEYPAIDLFIERAQRTQHRFALSAENSSAVAQICRLVGGMPLGVELAASWVHTLSCTEIAQEIEQSLDFLAVNHRNLPERQRSMRATFDHSWRLLSAEEQQVLRRLSVFRGGFQREAATAVAGATLPVLASLVSKSLVRRTDEGRYDLHELVRQYAAAHLHSDPGEEVQTRHAHAAHFLGSLDDHAGLFNHQHAAARRLLLREKENLRIAWLWSAAHGRDDLLQRAMHTFWLFHEMCFLLHEGRLLFSQALEAVTMRGAVGEATGTTAQVVQSELKAQQGWFLFRTGQFAEARPILEEAVAHLRQQHAPLALANALHHLSVLEWFSASFQGGEQYAQEALEINRQRGEHWWAAMSLVSLGYCAHFQGIYPTALRYFEEGLVLMRGLSEPRTTAVFIGSLSETMLAMGRMEETKTLLQEALLLATQLEDSWTVAKVYGQMGVLALLTGEAEKAQQFIEWAIDLFRERGDTWHWANSLNTLGRLYLQQGETSHAQQHFLEAWRLSSKTQLVPNMLTAVAGLATVQAQAMPTMLHAVVAYHLLHHPTSTQITKEYAEQLRLRVEATLSPAVLETAHREAHSVTLASLVAALTKSS